MQFELPCRDFALIRGLWRSRQVFEGDLPPIGRIAITVWNEAAQGDRIPTGVYAWRTSIWRGPWLPGSGLGEFL